MAPATAAQVLTFAATVAGFCISWSTLAADYTIYVPSNTSKTKVFIYVFFGFFLPLCLLEILGAALMNAASAYPPWSDGYKANGICGLLAAALHPAGRFGKFCMVVLAMSMWPPRFRRSDGPSELNALFISGIPAACAPTMYSFGISFQCVAPIFAYVPRWVFSIVATAMYVLEALLISGNNCGLIAFNNVASSPSQSSARPIS